MNTMQKNNKFLASKGANDFKHHNFYAVEGKKVLGGACCKIKWNWLYIDILCVNEKHRGDDIGTKLIRKVENFARENGYHGVYLETFDFQARPFYEKQGYTVCGKIEGLPPESVMWILSKRF